MKHFKGVVLKIMKYNKYTVKCVYQNYMVDDFSNLNSIDLDQAQTVLALEPPLSFDAFPTNDNHCPD